MKTKLEILTGILIALFYICGSVLIIEAAKADEVPLRQATWTPPKIPHCDKPLWERVRHKCDT